MPAKRRIQGLGWKPDTPDHRDFRWSRLVPPAKLPSCIDQTRDTPSYPVAFQQSDLGSCTGNAAAGGVVITMLRQGMAPLGPAGYPSRLMIYYGERLIEGTIGYDAGAEIRDGIKFMAQYGVVDESEWPYDVNTFTQRPPDACWTDAAKHLIKQYARVDQSQQAICGTLAAGYPIIFGFAVYESFEDASVARSGIMPLPGTSESLLGGHAVLMVGYGSLTDLGFDPALAPPGYPATAPWYKVRNSWGPEFGLAGHFAMPAAVAHNPDMADDFWAIELVEA